MPSLAFSKKCDEHHFKTTLIQLISRTQSTLQSSKNASTKKLLQAHLASLQLKQIQGYQQSQNVTSIKNEVGQLKKDIFERLEARLPETSMTDIKRQLGKNSDLATKKLVAEQTSSSTQLVDNKKGEKESSIVPVSQESSRIEGEQKVLNIQVSKSIVPIIAFTKPPAKDSIDLIKEAATNLRAAEKNMNYLERGQTSCIKSPKKDLIMKAKRNYSKFSDKNPMDTVFETPRPDEKKLLARSIAFYKDPTDTVIKRRIAKIYRNSKEICVVVGHPLLVEAKKEEKERIKLEKKQAALDAKKQNQKKEQAAILDKLQAVKTTTELPVQPTVITEPKDLKMQEESQKKRRFRYKLHSKRKVNFNNEEFEDQFPKKPTTTTQTSKPSVVFEEFKVVDPTRNIHGEPIVPKDEPVDWDILPIPELNLPISR
ncbi:hypothetical protein AgCh_005941 [Apium graveolens]